MRNAFIDKIIELRNSTEAYATAMIVRRKIPSSGKPGDQAVITADGYIHGWIGGGCTRGIILREALLAIKDGKPRMVVISPDAQTKSTSSTKKYAMTCQSGGEVEVYVEPVLPKPQIVLFGTSHIAMAVAKIASAMEYRITAVMHNPDKNVFPTVDELANIKEWKGEDVQDNAYVIVCTQGEGDVEALLKAISLNRPYLAFVASRKKAASIYGDLRQQGVTNKQLKTIKTPAGLDINAKLAEEVAVSIIAQIIDDFRKVPTLEETQTVEEVVLTNEDFYMNPVCNIPVQKSTAKHVLDYQGESVYFCCDGCKVSFEREPSKYMEV